MSTPIVKSDFQRLLEKRLYHITEATREYEDLGSMIPQIFKEFPSKAAFEEWYDVGNTPDPVEWSGKVEYQAIYPGFLTKIEPKTWVGGHQFEQELIEDKQFGVLDNRSERLMRAQMRKREKEAANMIGNGFSASFDYMTSEEGVALFSNSHTTKSGVSTASGFDNLGTSALTKTSFAATRLLCKGFKDDIGERFEGFYNIGLIVPSALVDTAEEILGSEKDPDSANNTINPQYKRAKIIEWPRLDDIDTNNWFMVDLDAMKRYLIYINRIAPKFEVVGDWDTYNLLAKCRSRYGFGFTNWRLGYGQQVS